MLISIIVPLYNKAEYLKRCFNSILKQKYPNIECIIIDDCSTDNSYDLAKFLIDNYYGNIIFKLFRNQKNEGVSETRNIGIINSNGKYFYFLDADDEITENCIESLIALANKYKDVEIIQGNIILSPLSINNYYDIKESHFPEYYDNYNYIKSKNHHLPMIPVNPVNKLIKKEFITKNNLFFLNGIIHEDELWSFFISKTLNKIAFTEEYCYIRYIIQNSIMTQENRYNSIYSKIVIANHMLNNINIDLLDIEIIDIYDWLIRLKKQILSDNRYFDLLPFYKIVINRIHKFYFNTIIITYIKLNFKNMKEIIKKIFRFFKLYNI